jgi:hypothetical protein
MNKDKDQPHAKYQHVYVVCRVDLFMGPLKENDYSRSEIANIFTITKVFPSAEAADTEAARLNKLNESKSCIYFVRIGRLVA